VEVPVRTAHLHAAADIATRTAVSVVDFDDSALMNCTDPPLTTIRQPIDAMGRAAVALLASQVAGQVVPADEMLFEPELVVRGSTGPVRTHDSDGRRAGRSAPRATARSRA
jgi:DNA-binding LacI/PurR family transcriptional regulator